MRAVLASGQRLRARLLLGADGASSAVRGLVGLHGATGHDYGQRGLVAYVGTRTAARGHRVAAVPAHRAAGVPALRAIGRCSIVWTLPDAEAERLLAPTTRPSARELTRAFDARLGEVRLGVGARGVPAAAAAGRDLRRRAAWCWWAMPRTSCIRWPGRA